MAKMFLELSCAQVMDIEGGVNANKLVDGALLVVQGLAEGMTLQLRTGRDDFAKGLGEIKSAFKK